MHKKLTVKQWNIVQVHNVRVETVSVMSTRVDYSQDDITVIVETVSGMSTRVDLTTSTLTPCVKTVNGMSTRVD